MDAVGLFAVFVFVLLLVSLASHRWRVPPFFALVGGALLFGLLAGIGLEATAEEIVEGVGRVFSAFGIIILSGSVIARVLDAEGWIDGIAGDVRRLVRDPVAAAGLLGYLLAVPFTCCITAFVALEPVLSAMGAGDDRRRSAYLYLAALGSLVSYAFVYPTPVVIPLVVAFGAGSAVPFYDAVAIPLSLALVLVLIVVTRRRLNPNTEQAGSPVESFHLRAWIPFLVIVLGVVAGLLAGLSHTALINLAMLTGAAAALGLATPARRHAAVLAGSRHAGVIVFDLVGAGALGAVVVSSGIAGGALAAMTGAVPVLLIPFLLAALVQTVQGSRVVTAVIVGPLLAQSGVAAAIDPVPLVLMVGAGACVVSYATDPYFWLVQRATGDPPATVVRRYTLPLAAAGVAVFAAALALELLV